MLQQYNVNLDNCVYNSFEDDNIVEKGAGIISLVAHFFVIF